MPKEIPLEEHLCYSLYSTSIAINRVYKPVLDALGITYPQYLVLCTLWEGDGRTISAIANHLSLEPSTITPLIKRLERSGFVARKRNARDERLVEVFLTQQGKELETRATCLPETFLNRSHWSMDEIRTLNERIRSLRAAFAEGK